MVKIRKMERADVNQVYQIEKELFSMPWSKEDFLFALEKEKNLYLVALIENKVVGYCGLWGILDEGQITNVAIKEEKQGQGIATLLLQQLLEQGYQNGLLEYTLEVRESNLNAIHVYKKLGFREEGVRKNFYQNPAENAIIMWIRSNYH